MFRGGSYRGYTRVRGGEVSAMMLGLSPRPGDVLSKRGRRSFIDVAVAAEFGLVMLDGARESAPGVGSQLRYCSSDLLAGANTRATRYGGEVGWGVPVTTGVVVSANVGGGLATGRQLTGLMGDWISSGRVLEANATARIQTFLATWIYVTGDLGYVHTRAFDGWAGPAAAQASDGSAFTVRTTEPRHRFLAVQLSACRQHRSARVRARVELWMVAPMAHWPHFSATTPTSPIRA